MTITLIIIFSACFILFFITKKAPKNLEQKELINPKEKAKTQYRLIHDGYINYLQYKSLLGWNYIRIPYYNTYTMSEGMFSSRADYETLQNGYAKYFSNKQFIEKFPYIEDYFIWYEIEQNRLNKYYRSKKQERENKKGKTTYL